MLQEPLVYLPLERYRNRYTEYLSGEKGMFVEQCSKIGQAVQVIAPDNYLSTVRAGVVVDYVRRSQFAFAQVTEVLELIQCGSITSSSVLYIEDFWHPGMEMIPYACTIQGIRPKVFAFCHAQSVDPNDFTVQMLPWIRQFEKGWAEWLTGIFVADEALKEMLIAGGVGTREKIHATGTVFSRDYIIKNYWGGTNYQQSRTGVVFTSRFDKEKNPDLFFRLAKKAKTEGCIEPFTALSGRKLPPYYREWATASGIQVLDMIGKEEYFGILAGSKVMVNTGVQDFVGYCQLDALVMGCFVLCPRWLTFPTLLENDARFLYTPGSVEDAWKKLELLLQLERMELRTDEIPDLWRWFGMKYEGSVARMLEVMRA